MNAQLSDLVLQAQQLSDAVTRPIPGSRKMHVAGTRPDLRVPMREVVLSETPKMFGAEANAPLALYDTSGPYTDPAHRVDLTAGLPALRARWIAERADTEALSQLSSEETKINVLLEAAGEITDNDIMLATASNANIAVLNAFILTSYKHPRWMAGS